MKKRKYVPIPEAFGHGHDETQSSYNYLSILS